MLCYHSISPGWFLMRAGKRWAALPQVLGESEADLDERLMGWLEINVFTPMVAVSGS